MQSDEWLSRYGPLENFNTSVMRTGMGTRITRVTTIVVYALRAVELKNKNNLEMTVHIQTKVKISFVVPVD